MKVIFSNSFKSEIKRIDGTVIITRAILCNDTCNSIEELKDSLAISSGDDYTDILLGVWNDVKKQFHIRLDIPDKYIVNEVEDCDVSHFNAIKFLWRNDEVAFMVINGFENNELEEIELNQIRNLFTIQLPEYTLAKNITTVALGNDTTFLEGGGINAGQNLQRLYDEGEIESTISKESYYHFCSAFSSRFFNEDDIPFINISGKRLDEYFTYYKVKSISINCIGARKEDGVLVRRDLPQTGSIDIFGTVTYDEYTYDGISSKCINSNVTGPLRNIPGLSLKYIDSNFRKIKINNNTKSINYEGQDLNYGKPSNTAVVYIEYYGYDVENNIVSTVPVKSNTIKLIYGKEKKHWTAEYNTKFYNAELDEKIPVIIFESNDINVVKDITITTSAGYKEDITLDEIKDRFSWYFEDNAIKDFFEFEVASFDIEGDDGFYDIKVHVTAKNNNNLNTWVPTINDESTIIKVTGNYMDNLIEFYVVQKKKADNFHLYECDESGNIIGDSEIVNLKVSQDGSNYFITSEDCYSGYYWKIYSDSSEITVSPDAGRITRVNKEDETGLNEIINVKAVSDNPRAIDWSLNPITIYKTTAAYKNVDFESNTNWVLELEAVKRTINLYQEKSNPSFEYSVETIKGLGIINVLIKSNYPYIIEPFTDSSFKGDLYFYNSDSDSNYTSETGQEFYKECGEYKTVPLIYRKGPKEENKELQFKVICNDGNVNAEDTTLTVTINSDDEQVRCFTDGHSKTIGYAFISEDSNSYTLPFFCNITPSSTKSSSDITISTDLAIKDFYGEGVPEYKYGLVNGNRPNQEITLTKESVNPPTKKYPITESSRSIVSVYTTVEGKSLIISVLEKRLSPELRLFDATGLDITENNSILISSLSGTTLLLYSRYKLAGNISYTTTDTDYALQAPSYINAKIIYQEEITEGDNAGFFLYKIELTKTPGLSYKPGKLYLKSYIPVRGQYLDGTVSKGIEEMIDQNNILLSYNVQERYDKNFYTQEDADNIIGVSLLEYQIVLDEDINFPEDKETIGETKYYLKGKSGYTFGAYESRKTIAPSSISTQDNAYLFKSNSPTSDATVVILDSNYDSISSVTEDSGTFIVSTGFNQRYKELGSKVSITTEEIAKSLLKLGKERTLSFKSSVTIGEKTDTFKITNTQKGIESALVYLNNGILDAIPGRTYGTGEKYDTLLEKVIDSNNNTNYIDIVIGSLRLSETSLTGATIDATGLKITTTPGANSEISYTLIDSGRTSYEGEATKPNVRLFIDSSSETGETSEIKFEVLSSDKSIIAGGIIRLTKSKYNFHISAPSNLYFSSDGIIIPGDSSIDGTTFKINSDCTYLVEKKNLQCTLESDNITFDLDNFEVIKDSKLIDGTVNYKINLVLDSRRDINNVAEGKLKLKIDQEEKATVNIHQGVFSPVYSDGDYLPIQISGDNIGKDLGEFTNNEILITTSPQSIEILDLDYTYSNNNNYSYSINNIKKKETFDNLCRLVGNPSWSIKEGYSNLIRNNSFSISSDSKKNTCLNFSCNLEDGEYTVYIDYWLEVKERPADSWNSDYTGLRDLTSSDIEMLEADENIVHGRLIFKHK